MGNCLILKKDRYNAGYSAGYTKGLSDGKSDLSGHNYYIIPQNQTDGGGSYSGYRTQDLGKVISRAYMSARESGEHWSTNNYSMYSSNGSNWTDIMRFTGTSTKTWAGYVTNIRYIRYGMTADGSSHTFFNCVLVY